MDEEKTKGRIWNGYACPGCRTVFRVAADFSGADVMCPSCKETLRLPKTPEEVPARAQNLVAPQAAASVPLQEPERPAVRAQDAEASVPRVMLSTKDGRLKLALALLVPLALALGAMVLFPPKKSTPETVARESAPAVLAETTPQEKPAPPPPPVAVSEMPEPPQPALPEPEGTPAPEVVVVQPVPEPEATIPKPVPAPQTPEPVVAVDATRPAGPPITAPDDGLVEAIPATRAPAPEQPAPAVNPEPETAVTSGEPVHTVARGDTLTKISRKYQVGIATIKKANAMKGDSVMLGQKLKIPGGITPVAEETAPPAVVETPAPAPQADRSHTVVRGDTLDRIARKYGVEPRSIMQANRMKNDVVRLGRKLVIPPARP